MIEILNRYTKAVVYSADVSDVRAALVKAVSENVNLKGADLEGAYLKGADLEGAYLKGAYLKGADLKGADLKGADLEGADLEGADLEGADLEGADLRDDTRLPTGETWKEYREIILPALCTAAGKTIQEVAAAWDCHKWSNCPMHAAFNFDGKFDGPNVPALTKLLRPRIEQFVQLFDANLLPCPCEVAASCGTTD